MVPFSAEFHNALLYIIVDIRPLLICHSILNMTIPKQLEIASIFIIEAGLLSSQYIGHKLTPKLTISGLGLFVPARRVKLHWHLTEKSESQTVARFACSD